MARIMMMSNNGVTLYTLRYELIEALVGDGHEVMVALPDGELVEKLVEMGCTFVSLPMQRRGMNPFADLLLLFRYLRRLRRLRPDVALGYTVKPNLYGAIACRLTRTPCINTVTGRGTLYLENHGLLLRILHPLQRWAFAKSRCVFFLNDEDRAFYLSLGLVRPAQPIRVVSGSGVNLDAFAFTPMPDTPADAFAFVGRIIREKGIAEFLESARRIKATSPSTVFHVAGFYDDLAFQSLVDQAVADGIITYHGNLLDIRPLMRQSTCVVLPSYGEGFGTALSEGASTGRPLITCDTYGCRENVDDGINGFLCKVADADSLHSAMLRFMRLSPAQKVAMGRASREKAVREMDRRRVTAAYQGVVAETVGRQREDEEAGGRPPAA